MTFPNGAWDHLPGWLSAAILLTAMGLYILSKLSKAHEGVAKLIPVLGKYWRQKGSDHDRVDAELADLRRQVQFLTLQLGELRVRDEMYWAWILSDQEWHRNHEFEAAKLGYQTIPHTPFMQFRERWLDANSKKGEDPF